MFLDGVDPDPRNAIHLVWAGERVKADEPLPSPRMDARQALEPGTIVVSLAGLVRIRLMANRDQDRAPGATGLPVSFCENPWHVAAGKTTACTLSSLWTGADRRGCENSPCAITWSAIDSQRLWTSAAIASTTVYGVLWHLARTASTRTSPFDAAGPRRTANEHGQARATRR
jgi:hypothetical protein